MLNSCQQGFEFADTILSVPSEPFEPTFYDGLDEALNYKIVRGKIMP